jgi:hypothetical protein
MKYVKWCALALVFAMLISPPLFRLASAAETPPIPIVVHAGTQADPAVLYQSATVKVAWDNNYNGRQISRADIEVCTPDGTVVGEWTESGNALFPTDAVQHIFPLRPYVETLANGTFYGRLRVWDYTGAVSGWSVPLWFNKDWVNLPPPGGCAILQ